MPKTRNSRSPNSKKSHVSMNNRRRSINTNNFTPKNISLDELIVGNTYNIVPLYGPPFEGTLKKVVYSMNNTLPHRQQSFLFKNHTDNELVFLPHSNIVRVIGLNSIPLTGYKRTQSLISSFLSPNNIKPDNGNKRNNTIKNLRKKYRKSMGIKSPNV